MMTLKRIVGMAIAISLTGTLTPLGAQEPDQDGKKEITVMSYNIRVGSWHSQTGEFESTEENLTAIAELIQASGVDIVLFQEVDNGTRRTNEIDGAAFLGEALGFEHHYAPAIEFQGGEYGVAMASRWPIEEARGVKLFQPDYAATHPEWGMDGGGLSEQRIAQVVRLDVDGTPVTVINTHLGLSQHQRQIQVQQIVALAEEAMGAPGGAVILGGDLNAEPDAVELIPLRQRMRDAYLMIPNERGVPRNIAMRERLTFRSDDPYTCIDYIFVSDRFEVLATEVLDTSLSDHLPVVSRLRLVE